MSKTPKSCNLMNQMSRQGLRYFLTFTIGLGFLFMFSCKKETIPEPNDSGPTMEVPERLKGSCLMVKYHRIDPWGKDSIAEMFFDSEWRPLKFQITSKGQFHSETRRYAFDERGNITESRTYDKDSLLISTGRYSYNYRNQLQSIVRFENGFKYNDRIDYDSLFRESGRSINGCDQWDYVYDEQGNLITYYSRCIFGPIFGTIKHHLVYNDFHKVITHTKVYTSYGSTQRTEIQYDSLGFELLSEEFFNGKIESTIKNYSHDAYGNITSYEMFDAEDDWTGTVKMEYLCFPEN